MELRKVRDFGELINDTFVFIKVTWKPLLKAFVSICGFFIVATIVLSIFYQLKISESVGQKIGRGDEVQVFKNLFNVQYFLLMIFSLLQYLSISLTVLCFVTLYQQKGEAPTTEEVWSYFKFYFLRFSLSSIPMLLLQVVGFVFCLLPGFYLWPIISMILAIIVLENATLGYAFNRGFKLIKDHWWETFGALLIICIVVYAGLLVFSLPGMAVSMASIFTGSVKKALTTYQILMGSISNLGAVFYILPYITICLAYFSLTERKEGIGLESRINMLGNHPKSNLPEEEF